jgi:hypothetical protein
MWTAASAIVRCSTTTRFIGRYQNQESANQEKREQTIPSSPGHTDRVTYVPGLCVTYLPGCSA